MGFGIWRPTMRNLKLLSPVLAASMALAPINANAAERVPAPLGEVEQLEGESSWICIAAGVAALVVLIVLISDDDDEPASP